MVVVVVVVVVLLLVLVLVVWVLALVLLRPLRLDEAGRDVAADRRLLLREHAQQLTLQHLGRFAVAQPHEERSAVAPLLVWSQYVINTIIIYLTLYLFIIIYYVYCIVLFIVSYCIFITIIIFYIVLFILCRCGRDAPAAARPGGRARCRRPRMK